MKPQKENPRQAATCTGAGSFAPSVKPTKVKGDAMHTINIQLPAGNYATHARAALAMLLRGESCDQYTYHRLTGYPMADFRTRISELFRGCNWEIDREYHNTTDHNGQPQRCKHYWIDREWLKAVYSADPVLAARCKLLANTDHVEV